MRQWKIRQQNSKDVAALCDALGCSHFYARVLINRGIYQPREAERFLRVSEEMVGDPYLFSSMEYVVERIFRSIRAGEKITVYGDYDVDGITATSLMVKAIWDLGGIADYYIPDRFAEGYGVNAAAVEKIAQSGTRLMITVDTGITAVDEVEIAKKLGMEVIITDHHECQPILPNTTIINPKQSDCGYPFSHLAGVGVVYKIACALDERYGKGDGVRRYAPFAAVGTIADIMPLIGENRYIVRRGLEDLRECGCLGFEKMIEQCLGEKEIDTGAIGFVIAPRINAAGRLGSAATGVELLTTRDPARAEEIVAELCCENNRRQEIENGILNDAIAMIERDPKADQRSAIVLWKKDWHNGVVGIVASRLKDRYQKPCFLFSMNEEFGKGSGRSVPPFSLFDALSNISSTCEKFGGHALAAGVLVQKGRLKEFRDAFCREVERFLQKNSFDRSIEIDCELKEGDLTLENLEAMESLAPFGRRNELPIYCMRRVRLLSAAPTANRNHMRLTLQCGRQRLTGFYFNVTPEDFCYQQGDLVDIVFEADINAFNGRRSVQLSLKDMQSSCREDRRIKNEAERIFCGKVCSEDVPSRDDAVAVYLYLKKQLDAGRCRMDIYSVPAAIQREQRVAVSFGKIYHSMRVLKEMGVLEYETDGEELFKMKVHPEVRVSLRDSKILKEITRKAGESDECGKPTFSCV